MNDARVSNKTKFYKPKQYPLLLADPVLRLLSVGGAIVLHDAELTLKPDKLRLRNSLHFPIADVGAC